MVTNSLADYSSVSAFLLVDKTISEEAFLANYILLKLLIENYLIC